MQDATYVKALVEEELGVPFESVFESMDPTPLGAASIGQAHRARLQPAHGGGDVCIKVQYPNAEHEFRLLGS